MEKFPLHWPVGWPRTRSPKRSKFKELSSYAAADLLMKELERLIGRWSTDFKKIILSTNVELREDGLPYSKQRRMTDFGAAVYFRYKDKDLVMACDTFDRVGCNIYAMAKSIEAMRGIERWGCSELMNRAFTGFQALPERGTRPTWFSILEIPENSNSVQIGERYRALAKIHHPDMAGGNAEKFIQIQLAYEEAMKNLNS